jgi:hypothetical protein
MTEPMEKRRRGPRCFLSDRRGAILVKAALTLPVVLGFTGLGIDAGMWYYEQRRMQTAADAAAMAATYALNREGASHAQYVAAGRNDAAANGFVHGVNATVTIPVSSNGSTVDVDIRGPGELFFSRMFLDVAPDISVDASAGATGGPPCLIALHPDQPSSAAMNGTPDILADGCAVHINSNGDHGAGVALEADGTPIMRADAICVNGTWTESATSYSPQPHHCAPIPDPLAALPPPPVDPTCRDSQSDKYNGNVVLSPGTYCHGLDIGGGADVTLMPGIYVLKDEGLTLRGNADVFGDGVMFYLTGNDPTIDLAGTGDLTLRAATSGTYGGILVFQDRTMTPGVEHVFRGTSNATYRGTIYLPTQDIRFVGTADAVTELPFITIVSTFRFSGTATWRFTAGSSPSMLPVLLQPRISLVE